MEAMRYGFEMALKNKLAQKTNSLQTEETAMMKYFRFFDTDYDGYLSKFEWFKGIEKIGVVVPSLQDLEQLFAYYDSDHDGKINYKEFADVVFKKMPVSPQKASPEEPEDQSK